MDKMKVIKTVTSIDDSMGRIWFLNKENLK
jgi:hypothetical protein